LNWIPFGGFVRMAGEEANPEETLRQGKGEFYSASVVKRLVVILAGATVNFLFGVVAFSVIFSLIGIPQMISDARIGFVMPDSPAAQSGLPTEVNIVSIVDETG